MKRRETRLLIGSIDRNRFWIERDDGRIFQIDHETKRVLERIMNGETVDEIAKSLHIEKEEIDYLLAMLHLDLTEPFILVDAETAAAAQDERVVFISPWLDHRLVQTFIVIGIGLAIAFIVQFFNRSPLLFVTSLKDQWLVAVLLTCAVLFHELGHLLTMPKNKNISLAIQWAGPIPMVSIVCNEAWKLPKRRRLRINVAGFVTDLYVAGVAAAIGIFLPHLSPWVCTFLIVHLFRTVFAIFPLLHGDGYWLLVDVLNQPNLWLRAVTELKNRKVNWFSLYAGLRYFFLLFIWFLFGYLIYIWTASLFERSLLDVIYFFLYPAPLFIYLNVLYQLLYQATFLLKKIWGKN